jgi:hypothetical protein
VSRPAGQPEDPEMAARLGTRPSGHAVRNTFIWSRGWEHVHLVTLVRLCGLQGSRLFHVRAPSGGRSGAKEPLVWPQGSVACRFFVKKISEITVSPFWLRDAFATSYQEYAY